MKPNNRIFTAVSGCLMMMCMGTVYAWSIFKKPLMDAHGWTSYETGLTFTLTLVFVSIATALGGGLVDRAGSRKVAISASLLFGFGNLLSAVAAHLGNKWLLWLGYGALSGMGNGLGYITALAVILRWFPDKKGFASGLAIMSFAIGGAIMGQMGPVLIIKYGVSATLAGLACLFIFVLPFVAAKLENPPEKAETVPEAGLQPACFDLSCAFRMNQFYIMIGVLYINATAGIALISNLSPMAQIQAGMSTVTAGTLILVGSVFNGLGRFFWAMLSDKAGRKAVFFTLFITQVPVLAFLPSVSDPVLFGILCCYVLFCYGGGFGVMPAFTADTFGNRHIGKIYGVILSAYGLAGITGPMLMEHSVKISGGYGGALRAAAWIISAGVILLLLHKKPGPEIASPLRL